MKLPELSNNLLLLAFSNYLSTHNGFPILETLWSLDLPWYPKLADPTSREVWPLCHVVEDSFWAMVDEMPLGASIPFESADEEEHHVS